MKKELIYFIFIFGFCIVIFPLIAKAQGYGISGLASLTYEDLQREDERSSTERNIFEQLYRLKYKNFIYHPKLLNFSLTGDFVMEDTESNEGTGEYDARNYNLNLNFLELSTHPFSIYALRNTSVSLTPFASGSSVQETTFQSYMLRGRIAQRGRRPSLDYGVSQNEKQIDGIGNQEDERERELFLRLMRKWTNSTLRLNYDFTNVVDNIASTDITSHALRLSGDTKRRLSRTTTLDAEASYRMESPSDEMHINARARINYIPRTRFEGYSDLKYEHKIEPEGAGYSISNRLEAKYRISRVLKASAGSSLSFNSGLLGESSSETVDGSLQYSNQLARNTQLSASGNAGFSAMQGEGSNNTSMNGGLSSSLSRSFPAIRSSVSSRVLARYSTSSYGDNTHKYEAEVRAESHFIKRLTAESELTYSVEQIADGEPVTILRSETDLKYFMFFGWRARLELRGGATIQHGSTESQFFFADEDFRFIFHRNLFLESHSRYEKDLLNSWQNLSTSAALKYNIRRISLRASYGWRVEENETSSITTTDALLKITRTF